MARLIARLFRKICFFRGGDGGGGGAHPWRRWFGLALGAPLGGFALVVGLAACLGVGASVPFPHTVLVPHPHRVPAGLSEERLQKMYTASPNRDPDGRGALPVVWRQSQMTLVVAELARQREAMNELALARTPEEQARKMEQARAAYRENVVFDGMLIGDLNVGTDPDWYLPDGLYLVDDLGTRFKPLSAQAVRPLTASHVAALASLGNLKTGDGRRNARFLHLVFPGAAVGATTRAVTLYFAAVRRRISFTWIFDPAYRPPGPVFRAEAGSGLHRMFRTPQG